MKGIAITALALALGVAAVPQERADTPADAALNVFLRLHVDGDDIRSERTRARWVRGGFSAHEGWIELESISFGGSALPTSGTRAMTASRHADAASAILERMAASRTRVNEAVLVIRTAGNDFDFYRLEGLQVTLHSRPAADGPTDRISFNFSKIEAVR